MPLPFRRIPLPPNWVGFSHNYWSLPCWADMQIMILSSSNSLLTTVINLQKQPRDPTNSLPTTAISLQKQPRDAHKFITNHHNQSSNTAQRCTQIPTKDFLGQFKGFSPVTTWAKVCQGACTASSAWDSNSHAHQVFPAVRIWTSADSMFQFPVLKCHL